MNAEEKCLIISRCLEILDQDASIEYSMMQLADITRFILPLIINDEKIPFDQDTYKRWKLFRTIKNYDKMAYDAIVSLNEIAHNENRFYD